MLLAPSRTDAQGTDPTGPPAPVPLAFSPRGILTGVLFERNLNTFNWFGTVAIDTSIGSLSLKMSDQYISNIILIDATSSSPEKRLQSNRHNLSFLPGWRLSDDVAAEVLWSSLVYSDAKDIGLSRASFSNLYGGVRYTPSPGIVFNPMGGYRWDDQGGFVDNGVSYDINAYTRPYLIVDDYQLSGAVRFSQDHVDPRLLENHLVRAGMQKTFFATTRDSLEIQFSRTRREYYSLSVPAATAAIDTNIDSRVDDLLGFSNLLDYEISRGMVSSFFIGVLNRTLDKDIRYAGTGTQEAPQFGTQIGEFYLNTFVQARYQALEGGAFLTTRLSYNERNETHVAKPLAGAPDALFREVKDTEKTNDNHTRTTVLTGDLGFPLSASDAVKIAGSASILRYDTPHELNVEDRDEQLLALGISTFHNISQYLDLELLLSGSMNHVVYLAGERSANNNINRILRFRPRVEYRPFPGLTSNNTFEVLANYTVYDFEEQSASIRSFSYRQFSLLDSTIVPLSHRVSLDFFVYLRLYERGQLRWDEFTERNESAFVDETYAVQVRYTPVPSITFAAGIRYFSQTRYSYESGEKTFGSRLKSFGPTCQINAQVNRNSLVGFSGWFEERRQSEGTSRSIPNMSLNVQLTL